MKPLLERVLFAAVLAAAMGAARAQTPVPGNSPSISDKARTLKGELGDKARALSDKSRTVTGASGKAVGRDPAGMSGQASAKAPPGANCGTYWTGWTEDPNADLNPCPKDCERGERQLVNTSKQGDKTLYAARFQCYRGAATPAVTTETLEVHGLRPRRIATEALRVEGLRPRQIVTEALVVSGPRARIVETPALEVRGKR